MITFDEITLASTIIGGEEEEETEETPKEPKEGEDDASPDLGIE